MSSRHDKRDAAMDRRAFLKKTAVACGAAVGAGLWGYAFYSNEPIRRKDERIYTFKKYRVEDSKEFPVFVVVHGKDVGKMLTTALDQLGGLSRFVGRGERILIKPNVGWDRQPEQAANTNPALVGAMVALCRDAGASEVWVTDVSINDPYRSFGRSGIEAAVKKSGGTVKFTTEGDFVLTDLKGELLTVWPVSSFYHQVDKVINMPVVKHHSLTGATIAMKNWYGILGGRRNRLHQEIHTSITDLAAAVRPTLTVTDATRVLVRNGPTGGNLADVAVEDTIIAGLDEVAMDSYGLQFLGADPGKVDFLAMGEKRGLGFVQWKTLDFRELSV